MPCRGSSYFREHPFLPSLERYRREDEGKLRQKHRRGFLEAPGKGKRGEEGVPSREDRFGVTGTPAGACRSCGQRARLSVRRTPSCAALEKSGRREIKGIK